jgi:hypothetical protein
MDPHDSNGIAASRTMLALHGAAPGPLGLTAPGKLPVPTSPNGRKGGASPTQGVLQPPLPPVPGRP